MSWKRRRRRRSRRDDSLTHTFGFDFYFPLFVYLPSLHIIHYFFFILTIFNHTLLALHYFFQIFCFVPPPLSLSLLFYFIAHTGVYVEEGRRGGEEEEKVERGEEREERT